MPPLRVATANIRDGLSREDATHALAVVVAQRPDLVALQEWYPLRRGSPGRAVTGYRWRAPLLGGCAVGARDERFAVRRTRTHWLSLPGRAPRTDRGWGLEPGRAATVMVAHDELTGREMTLVSFHLVWGVQADGRYRDDRGRLVARHRREAAKLSALVERLSANGQDVFVAGDSNFDGFDLAGLTSAWADDRGTDAGTLGRRRVDDVFSLTSPSAVTLLDTGSDHRAVLADYLLTH